MISPDRSRPGPAGLCAALALAGCTWKVDPGPAPLKLAQRVSVVTVPGDDRAAELVVMVRAGSAYDPVGREGLAWQTANAITHGGTPTMSAEQVQQAWARMGVKLGVTVGSELVNFKVVVPPDRAVEAAGLLGALVATPALDVSATDLARLDGVLGARLPTLDAPDLASRLLRWMVYEGHPYGHPAQGWQQTSLVVTALDVTQFLEDRYLRSVVAAGVGGLVDGAAAASALAAPLDTLPARLSPDVTPRLLPTAKDRSAVIVGPTPDLGTMVALGHALNLRWDDPDGVAVLAAVAALDARLERAIGAHSGVEARWVEPWTAIQGQLEITLSQPGESVSPLLASVLREVELFAQDGVNEDDLAMAKRAVQDELHPATGQLERAMAAALLDGPDPATGMSERLDALTPAAVNAAIARWIHPDRLSIALVARDPALYRAAFIEDSGASSVQPDGYALGVKSLNVVSNEELNR